MGMCGRWGRGPVAVWGIPLVVVVAGMLPACDSDPVAPEPGPHEALEARLDSLMDRVIGDPAIHNANLAIVSRVRSFQWSAARGYADPSTNLAMTVDDPFRSHSIGKMTLAALTLRLVESGLLDLDAPIASYVADSVIAGIHVLGGTDYSHQITVRQALGHRAGLADYFFDGDADGNGIADFVEAMFADPDRMWDPVETVAWTRDRQAPLFPPGNGWHYTDTGYVLVGLAIETITGKALHEVYRERLFDPLGMDHTYMEFRETPRTGPTGRSPSHVFFGEADYTDWRSVSSDWAGGGLITTIGDLELFINAFVEQTLFASPTIQAAMETFGPTDTPGMQYGLGVFRLDPAVAGVPYGLFVGHGGFAGSLMFYDVEHGVTIVGTLNQAQPTQVNELEVLASVARILHEEWGGV